MVVHRQVRHLHLLGRALGRRKGYPEEAVRARCGRGCLDLVECREWADRAAEWARGDTARAGGEARWARRNKVAGRANWEACSLDNPPAGGLDRGWSCE